MFLNIDYKFTSIGYRYNIVPCNGWTNYSIPMGQGRTSIELREN